jgi:2'-5' RNA ligase
VRLFFAIWPDSTAVDALARLAVEVAGRTGGRATPADKIHLTLAFLGEVAAERSGDVAAAGEAVRARPFELEFDTLGWFRGARVAWIGCSRPAQELLEAHALLEARLRDRGFILEDRAFAPHVTLARKIRRSVPRAAVAPIRWPAREIALVQSGEGTGRYTTIGRWALGTDQSP